ncbi:CPBP family intramembrane metalloprotease [Isoptericola chiayiensis]|uniref:CPBP family intramembrane metalloprotease n=1 Tax=Isoptericola chiayiensis TaxID=579446 RepID=A0ABP8XZ11_9MICO|nr:CPBP family intramembrane glutamic endopeptidase [Isoptericola chiayiensis]NOW01288.1 membrane protease YdiL (CAAX protease family) [Isoptericola chiayiensis]
MRALWTYLGISFGVSWLVALPLWLGDGIDEPLLPVLAVAMMFTPALAALVVVRFVERRPLARALGLTPVRPWGRFLGWLGIALVVPVALVAVALPVASVLGLYEADLVEFSGFRETLDAQLAAVGGAPLDIPVQVLVIAQLASIVLGAVINTVPALGEEIGWRGWLLPTLVDRYGTAAAVVVSGLIWGLWHAPLVLLGYNYPDASPLLALVMMVGFCTVVGAVFSWLRIRSGNVWAPALAHGALNAAAGMHLLFVAAGTTVDTTHATILGWSGWIVPLALVAVLAATGQFRARQPEPTATP